MTYSIIGILALIVLLITNRDILWHGRNAGRHQRYYRLFLLGVMAYYITDLLWGILDEWQMTAVLYADTAVHFAAMAAAVMLWTQYVILPTWREKADLKRSSARRGGLSLPLSLW